MADRLISKKEVCWKTSYSRAHVDRMVHDEDYEHYGFPKPVKPGFRVLFSEREVDEWIEAQLAKRDSS